MFRNATDEALSSIDVLICCNCAGKCCDSVHRSVRLSKFSNAVTQCLVNATLVCTSHSGNEHKLTWSDELSELKSAFLNSHCVGLMEAGHITVKLILIQLVKSYVSKSFMVLVLHMSSELIKNS